MFVKNPFLAVIQRYDPETALFCHELHDWDDLTTWVLQIHFPLLNDKPNTPLKF